MLSRDDLKALALFESLGDEQLDQLLDRHRESTHQADQVIVMEQDWGEPFPALRWFGEGTYLHRRW